ncbi:hypothetical protein CAL7716_016130 [Calothrix sp. PCC 7716]|nr:hypothetical protein CAL7716_016130 [Calothrix sp. PCC 7716]
MFYWGIYNKYESIQQETEYNRSLKKSIIWGRRDLNPHDRLRSTDFHPFVAFTTTNFESTVGFKDWTLPLPSA